MQAAALPSTPVITLTPPTWGLPDICPSLPYILERCQVTFRTEGRLWPVALARTSSHTPACSCASEQLCVLQDCGRGAESFTSTSPGCRPSQRGRWAEGWAAHLRSRARATHSSWRWPTLQFSPASVTREARPSMPEMTSCRYFGTLPYMPRYLVVMLVCTG